MTGLEWWILPATIAGAWFVSRAWRRVQLSAAKHGSLTGHPRMARRIAALLPRYALDDSQFFVADGAPAEVADVRRAGFQNLAALFATRFAASAKLTSEAEPGISDLQFTSRNRVPFPFAEYVRKRLRGGAFMQSSFGRTLTDLDGNRFYDLTGSYGMNVFGNDFYKECIRLGSERVAELGPLLGPYHPIVAKNVRRLQRVSGLEEVSFHMSGTEAVMQAVRLARYHTKRRYLVRFCGAYHGWWGDVQPGVGNPQPARDTFTLEDMSEATLRVLRSRDDIACVLVNPLQALHPNSGAPADSGLVDSSRSPGFDRARYGAWLRDLRTVCSARGIALIFDEVFVGFRIAPGGAQEFFGVAADLVTYGKTVGGGLPVGVLCGRRHFMQRYREDSPGDICFARGTFNAHPYVMGAMDEFLTRIEGAEVQAIYLGLDERWNARASLLNERLRQENLPVRVANLSSIWTIHYLQPSRYNWMLQYYLRAQGIALSWVGTGRLIFSLDYDEADFNAVAACFLAGVSAMQADGWWWKEQRTTNRSLRRRLLREMLQARWAPIAPPPRVGSLSSRFSKHRGPL